MARYAFGQSGIKRGRSPDDTDQFIEKKDQAKGCQYLVQVIPFIKGPEDHNFNNHSD